MAARARDRGALLVVPAVQLNPSEAQAKDLAGKKADDAVLGLDALTAAGISHGALKPFDMLVERSPRPDALRTVTERLARTPGIAGVVAPPGQDWRRGSSALVEAFPSGDGAAKSVRGTISNLQDGVLPAVERELGGNAQVTLGGIAPEDRDFVHWSLGLGMRGTVRGG